MQALWNYVFLKSLKLPTYLDLLNVKGCENYLQNFAVSGLFLLGLDSKSYKIQQIYILFCTSDKCLCTKVQFYHDKIWTRIFQVAPVGQDFHVQVPNGFFTLTENCGFVIL